MNQSINQYIRSQSITASETFLFALKTKSTQFEKKIILRQRCLKRVANAEYSTQSE